uniref:Uncharacterized protein n=1 Tax=Salarias fasciatus TaxID=181472 RepID=A0A672HHJ2_SALFA
MANASSILSEDKFLCSICLEVFTQPVSTPCGHNFCCDCIHMYWDNSQICQCPFCKKTFASRPELHVNTTMSDLAAEFARMAQVKASASDPQLQEQVAILCDICSELKHKAVKSCLVCLTSFCEAHLEPHQRVSVLKRHKLIDPISNLDEKLCQKHNKLLELFCRTDQTFICVMCFKTDHKSHKVMSLEEEYEAMMVKKDKVMSLKTMEKAWCHSITSILFGTFIPSVVIALRRNCIHTFAFTTATMGKTWLLSS